MSIVITASTKGGTSKTTTTCNVAVELQRRGIDVAILDADPQQSAAKFAMRREAVGLPPIPVYAAFGDICEELYGLDQKHSVVLVDCGGYNSDELQTGALLADLLYVPAQPSILDLETLPDVVSQVIEPAREHNDKLQCVAMLAKVSTNLMVQDAQKAREYINTLPAFALASVMIRERQVFKTAMLQGKGVVELFNPAAKAEIQLLTQEIEAKLGGFSK